MTDYLINLLAEFTFVVLLIITGWIFVYFKKRRKLYRFFNIKDTKRINVYLSRLTIPNGGSIAINGQRGSYSGIAVVQNEVLVANYFRERFNYFIPKLSDNPGFLGNLLLSDIKINISVSETNQNQIDNSTSFISLGSPTYNVVSGFVESHTLNKVRIPLTGTININGLQPMNNLTYGFIERIFDSQNKRSMFYVAGLSELGTIGAANFLSNNWKVLYDKFKGEKNFLVVIEFKNNFNLNNWIITHQNDW